MSLALAFPNLDPVIVSFGPVAIRWYALAYVVGLVLGWRYIRHLAKGAVPGLDKRSADDFLVWCTLGVIIGGRLGYVIFYQPGHFIDHPGQIPVVWQGGMSFHGGMLGVIGALFLFARLRKINPLSVADAAACAVPIGLFFGRAANFINGELYGRASDVSWAMVFPGGGPEPRHPSQLYEAFLEGLVLFAILTALTFILRAGRRPGLLTGVFLIGYGLSRIVVELFREPDAFLGTFGGISMGQILSLPMLLIGLYLALRTRPWRRLPAGG
ncbi:MAG TPA: prolipoprotein diacylglyceryl transferase [Alphaproteobacteria bacterium]|nr:prolipoprotein diacylglyceryl transferase [Alphaproteobacteria bacterium]